MTPCVDEYRLFDAASRSRSPPTRERPGVASASCGRRGPVAPRRSRRARRTSSHSPSATSPVAHACHARLPMTTVSRQADGGAQTKAARTGVAPWQRHSVPRGGGTYLHRRADASILLKGLRSAAREHSRPTSDHETPRIRRDLRPDAMNLLQRAPKPFPVAVAHHLRDSVQHAPRNFVHERLKSLGVHRREQPASVPIPRKLHREFTEIHRGDGRRNEKTGLAETRKRAPNLFGGPEADRQNGNSESLDVAVRQHVLNFTGFREPRPSLAPHVV